MRMYKIPDRFIKSAASILNVSIESMSWESILVKYNSFPFFHDTSLRDDDWSLTDSFTLYDDARSYVDRRYAWEVASANVGTRKLLDLVYHGDIPDELILQMFNLSEDNGGRLLIDLMNEFCKDFDELKDFMLSMTLQQIREFVSKKTEDRRKKESRDNYIQGMIRKMDEFSSQLRDIDHRRNIILLEREKFKSIIGSDPEQYDAPNQQAIDSISAMYGVKSVDRDGRYIRVGLHDFAIVHDDEANECECHDCDGSGRVSHDCECDYCQRGTCGCGDFDCECCYLECSTCEGSGNISNHEEELGIRVKDTSINVPLPTEWLLDPDMQCIQINHRYLPHVDGGTICWGNLGAEEYMFNKDPVGLIAVAIIMVSRYNPGDAYNTLGQLISRELDYVKQYDINQDSGFIIDEPIEVSDEPIVRESPEPEPEPERESQAENQQQDRTNISSLIQEVDELIGETS